MHELQRFLRAASLLAVAALPLAATHSPAWAATVRAATFHPKITVAKPRPLFRVNGARSLTTLRYTIVDRGAPAQTRFSVDYQPIVFNNTGQIAGNAYDSVAQHYVCELYDGKRFRDLSAAASITGCNVEAIGDANASGGSVDVVGYAYTVYDGGDSKAFYAQAPLGTGDIKTTIFPNDQALLTGINAAGTAIGIGFYLPNAGFVTEQPPFLATAGRGSLALAQPACLGPAPGCGTLSNTIYEDEVEGLCPFGGCQITADGTLLLTDVYTGSFETVAPDGSAHDIVLPADLNSFPTINNAKQLAFSIVTIVRGVTEIRTQIYTIATSTATTVPPLPGNSCRQYIPLSMNDEGHVLGYTSDCPNADGTYFTYDPTHGTLDLDAAIPTGSFSVFPQAVNDKDEILIGLAPSDGDSSHWALLEPIAGGASRAVASASHWAMRARPASATGRPRRTIAARNAVKPRQTERFAARSEPRPARLRPRSATSGVPAYAVIDYGAPPVTNYALEMPIALNNTGQIVGIAQDRPYVNGSTCVLFDGARFRNISASPAITNCTPRSINDESSTGRLAVVGTTYATYSYGNIGDRDEKAFAATIAPGTGYVGTTLFGVNDMSDLTGINAAGLAIGVGDYGTNPNEGSAEETFFLPPGKFSLDLLQPACATSSGANCGFLLEIGCAFGGCNITADGSLYLYNEVIDADGTVQPVRIDGESYGSIINNAKQILYYRDVAHASGPDTVLTTIYQVGTGTVTTVPPLAGSSCGRFAPLSFNNLGEVLGFTDDCSTATDYTYFIYDPVNGTRDLLAELPAGNASIEPIGINDKGEIAFGLTLPSGVTHWGLLVPTAPASVRNRRFARPRPH